MQKELPKILFKSFIKMLVVKSSKQSKLEHITFLQIKNIDLKYFGLSPTSKPNIYSFNSKHYKFLNYKIKPKLNFLIDKKVDSFLIKLDSFDVEGINNLLNHIDLNLEIIISQKGNLCELNRNILLRLVSKEGFFKALPNVVISKLLSKSLHAICSRFDKKLESKLLKFKSN